MSRQEITKLVSVSALGLLVLIFGIVLLSVLSSTLRPTHTDFVFAISRRALNVAAVTLSVILAVLIFFFARALYRRQSKLTAVEQIVGRERRGVFCIMIGPAMLD